MDEQRTQRSLEEGCAMYRAIRVSTKVLAILGLLVTCQSARAQSKYSSPNGNFGQSVDDCDCQQSSRCGSVWRCIWGQMVSDGTGGKLRIYGYPTPACCGRQPCGYPIRGTGGVCFPHCPPTWHRRCRQRPYDVYQTSMSAPFFSSRSNGDVAAWCIGSPAASCSGQSDWEVTPASMRNAQRSVTTLPAGLKLASKPTPIKISSTDR